MSGVMRVTKLVKFLPRFGWEPIVLTVKKIAYFHYDERLLEDWRGIKVFRAGSVDPARIRYLLAPGIRRSEGGISRAGWLSNVLLFPDAKVGWYPFALALGKRIIREENPAAIFATAPPYTTLKLGATLKQYSGLPLVSDFRDPWPMGLVPPPKFRRKATERFRHDVLAGSDAVLAVNHGTASFLEGRAEILENGYDPDEFAMPPAKFEGFSIVHVGNVWENEREFLAVLEVIKGLTDVKLRLVGRISDRMRDRIQGHTHFINLGLLPHGETLAAMKGADLLFYLSKPGQAAGIKLYEYLGSGRPILSVCDECTEAARLIEQHHAGEAISTDVPEIRAAIERAMRGELDFAPQGIERYNRLHQAERLAQILNEVAAGQSRKGFLSHRSLEGKGQG
jgi:glycosyltransferase involved in cell wall biosynthesis